MTVYADALAQALGEDGLGLHINELILEGGAPALMTNTFISAGSFLHIYCKSVLPIVKCEQHFQLFILSIPGKSRKRNLD